jgi:hypothetical protein
MRAFIVSLLLISSVAACHDATSLEWNGVKVVVQSQGMDVQNSRDEPLGVFAVNRLKVGEVQWTRCTDTSPACLRVPARGHFYVPFSEVREYDAQSEIVVYTWTVENGQAVDIASIVVGQ